MAARAGAPCAVASAAATAPEVRRKLAERREQRRQTRPMRPVRPGPPGPPAPPRLLQPAQGQQRAVPGRQRTPTAPLLARQGPRRAQQRAQRRPACRPAVLRRRRARAQARAREAPHDGDAPCALPPAPARARALRPSSCPSTSRRASSPPRPAWRRRRHCPAAGSWLPTPATPPTSGHARASRGPTGHARAKSGRPSRASGGCAQRHPSSEAWTTLRRSRCRIRPPCHSPEASSNRLPRAATRPQGGAPREFLSPTVRQRCRSPPSLPCRPRRPVQTP